MSAEYEDSNKRGEYAEWEPSFHRRPATDIFAMDQHQYCQCDHVPSGAVLVSHDVECTCHVTVAIVTTQVVHPTLVNLRRLRHRPIIRRRSAVGEAGVQLPVLGRGAKGHVVLGNVVGTGKVSDDALRGGNAHVANEGEQPR